jgi:hypothetical protein
VLAAAVAGPKANQVFTAVHRGHDVFEGAPSVAVWVALVVHLPRETLQKQFSF